MGKVLLSHHLQLQFNWAGTKGWLAKDGSQERRGLSATRCATVWTSKDHFDTYVCVCKKYVHN